MPYKINNDLPENITNVLPHHAQDIYREAFNNAWENYECIRKRRESSSREETAHKVAWAAVKKKYIKVDGRWTAREIDH